MTESTIFLNENFLEGQTGDGILLANSGVIGTSQVGSNVSNPMLTLSNYNTLANNVLLNPQFATGDLTNWNQSGTPVVQVGDFAGVIYQCSINNLSNINQQVSGFSGKHPIFEFWHKGQEIILSLEMRDGSNVYTDGVNRIIPNNDDWTRYSIGMYNYSSTAVSAKITLASVWDGSIVSNCSLIASDYYSSVNIGDEYNSDITDIVRVSGRKLMIGPGLPSINSALLDVRGNSYLLGDLTVTGTITSGPVYGSIGTQRWVSNIIFTSGSQTQINFTSGNIQLVSGQIFGINSGSMSGLTQITYLYLDSDISSTVLQTSLLYTDVIGANKIFIGTAYPGTTGYASFVSQSNNLPLINASDLITPFSIVNGNLAVDSVTATNISVSNLSSINANMGTLTAGIITLGSAGSYLNFGANPPITSSGGIGLAGLYQDYLGLYSLSGTTLNASLTSAGILVSSGNVKLDSDGVTIISDASYLSSRSIKFIDDSSNVVGEYYVALGTAPAPLEGDLKITAPTGRNSYFYIKNTVVTTQQARIYQQAISGSQTAEIYLAALDSGSSQINFTANQIISSVTNLGITDIGSTPNANAILDVSSTTKAFMPPRMTTAQRNAIASPTASMVIYNSSTNKLNVYTTVWEAVTSV